MVLNNLDAQKANNRLMTTNKNIKSNLEKLSSGYRVNRAADDAAGLAISEKMRSQIRGLNQAVRNVNDGISLISTADGAMVEVHAILNRSLELALTSSNGIYSNNEREMLQSEIDQLMEEINMITESTNFNERPLLQGHEDPPVVLPPPPGITQVEIKGSLPSFINPGTAVTDGFMSTNHTTEETYRDTITNTDTKHNITHEAAILDFSAFDTDVPASLTEAIDKGFWFTCCTCESHYSIKFTTGTTSNREISGSHFIYNVGIDNVTSASDLIDRIVTATNGNPNGHYTKLAKYGKKLVVFDDRTNALLPTVSGGAWVGWPQSSASVTHASTQYGKFGAGIAVTKQIAPPTVDNRFNGDLFLQIGDRREDLMQIFLPNMKLDIMSLESVSIVTQENAWEATDLFSEAIDYVSTERGRMGAYQNRLEHTRNNLENTGLNIQDAESRIRDLDMAYEMMYYTKNTILIQSGQAMLAQANQQTQGILKLLA